MKRRILFGLVILSFVVMILGGCAAPPPENVIPEQPDEKLRIISLMPSNTEILFALGLGDQLVGVTNLCDYPPGLETAVTAGRIQRVGDAFALNEELIVSLEPTLVILGHDSDASRALAGRLNGLGITTEVIFPQSIQQMLESVLRLGEITGRLSEAESLVARMEADFAEIRNKTAGLAETEKPRVLMLLDLDFLFVAGPGTLEDELISMAGAVNVIETAGYNAVSEELIIESDPDVILNSFPFRERILNEKEIWQDLSAVRAGAIYDIDGDLVNRPAPRLVDGLRQLLTIFHPDL